MDYKKILIAFILLMVAQFLTWFQMYGQLRWKELQNIYLIGLSGIPLTFLYWYAVKIGYDGFGETWPMRILQFICGAIIFALMANIYLGEGVSTKNYVSLALCLLIVLVQIFWK